MQSELSLGHYKVGYGARMGVVCRRSRVRRRRGVVAVLFMLMLVVLLLCVAFAVDMPRVMIAAQRTQDVCDAAVLAGAAVLPDSAAAVQQVQAIAAANSPEGAKFPVAIDPAQGDVQWYGPGDNVPNYRVLGANERVLWVRARSYTRYFFLPVIGRRGMTVTRQAMALLTRASGLACIFSKDNYEDQKNSEWGVLVNGSGATIDGRIHANGKVRFNGSGHTVTKPVEYRGQFKENGSGNDFQGGSGAGERAPYPVNYQWSDFPYSYSCGAIKVNGSGKQVPGGASRVHVQGDLTVNGSGHTFPSGTTYLVDGDVKINGSGIVLDGITIIAKGSITLNGSATGTSVTPNEPGIFLISYEEGANQPSITFNGSGHNCTGIMFAPTGSIDFNGSGQMVYQGALIGQSVTANGSGFTVRGMDTGGEAETTVQLVW
jgi:hypothetical protein